MGGLSAQKFAGGGKHRKSKLSGKTLLPCGKYLDVQYLQLVFRTKGQNAAEMTIRNLTRICRTAERGTIIAIGHTLLGVLFLFSAIHFEQYLKIT